MRDSGALCSAILRVIHPELYRAGREALLRAAHEPLVRNAMEFWPSIFHSVHLIANRESTFHRDISGSPTWMELLVTLGTYDRATLVARNLGIQFAYSPGSIIALSSYLVHHGVAQVSSDRLCYAWFMNSDLTRNFNVPPVPWVRHTDVLYWTPQLATPIPSSLPMN